MSVSAGHRFGPYEIVSRIGEGGMGEVWRARDTRLDRSVAIKVLSSEFAGDAHLRLRFEREARAISQLNHPNICTIHDVGEEAGVAYIVMELLDGESLADRLCRGPLPIADVLTYGMQIADALQRAHKAGIVHRDLKPGNVMVNRNGAKLLDFGLAKTFSSPAAESTSLATEHKPLTREGTIVGTFQYMAPEQFEGEEADERTDIFALGALLYEMATGTRAFSGKTRTSLIAAIVQSEPRPIAEIRPLTPPAFEHVVQKCLAKDRDDRWQSAHDIAQELEWIRDGGARAGVAVPRTTKLRERAIWAAVLILTMAAGTFVAIRRQTREPLIFSSITLPLRSTYSRFGQAAFSPDGNEIVFVANIGSPTFDLGVPATLWVRALDQLNPRLLPGTEGALEPFWSPDGKSIGFFANGKLKRVSVDGGPPQTICDSAQAWGGSWNKSGTIIFGRGDSGIYQVDAKGGTARALTRLSPREEAHRWPAFLPDGDHFLFLGDASLTSDHHIKIGSLHDGSSHELLQAVSNAIYAEPGDILFVRNGSLIAQKLDLKRLALEGEPRLVAELVTQNDEDHHFEFTMAPNGRLLYRAARMDAQLTWVDRTGRTLGKLGGPARLGFILRLSPDQQRVVTEHMDADGRADDLWLVDGAHGNSTRLTFDPASDATPVWSGDGTKIAFASTRTGVGTGDLYIAEVANPSNAQRALSLKVGLRPMSWSHDGEWILLNVFDTTTQIWVFSTTTHEARPYVVSSFNNRQPALSPDGHTVAYVSDESGREETYVEDFPTHAHRRQISSSGGIMPRWRADGRELFYIAGGQLMSVDMKNVGTTPEPLFQLPGNSFDVSADGQRFIVDDRLDDSFTMPMTLMSDWKRTTVR